MNDNYFAGGYSPSYGGDEDNIAPFSDEVDGGFPTKYKLTQEEYDASPDKSYYKPDPTDPGMYRVSKMGLASTLTLKGVSKSVEAAKPVAREVGKAFVDAATQKAMDKTQSILGAGCGCGLTYAGAAEIYAAGKGLPMTGTLGGGGDDDVDGGCCGFVSGGLDMATIRSYDKTINSITKDQLVDDIIASLSALGLKASGSDRNAKVSSILGIIPNQRKNGKSFKADAESQAKICKTIGKVINDRYGRDIVDVDADPANLCQAVSEIAHSLRGDIHLEFIMVQDEVKRILKNILLLKTTLEQQYEQLVNKIQHSKDTQLQNKATIQLSLHKMILDEVTRQIVMLQNLVDVTLTPADVDIAKLLTESEEDIPAIIQGIERGPRIGTTQFGDVISKVLTDLGVTAGYAAIIEKALKTTGVTVDEYAKSPNLKDIKRKIEDRLLNDNLKDKDLHEYLKSAELLYKNFYRAKDIASVINKNKSGGQDDMEDGYSASYEQLAEGGGYCAEDSSASAGEWKTGLDSRVKDKRFEKQVIFRAFNRQINEQFDVIVKSLNILASKIGSEIPITEQLDGFRDAISKLKPLLNSKNAFISLIGYYNDAVSKERRETFVAQLRMINTFVESLMEMSIYSGSASYFRDIHSKISELMKTIDQYSDRITAKYGSGERCEPATEGGAECEWMEDGVEGGRKPLMPDDTVSRKTALTIRDAITKFDYYYRTAQVKDNLAHSSKELQHYAENYTETRATAIAKKIDYARKMRDDMIKDLDDEKKSPWFIQNKQEKKYIKKFLEEQTLGLVNFWRTVEAIDEYMRVFTDGIARHPEEVKDIKDMLDETEVIYDAYDDETGNELVRVFELFPNCVSGYGANKYDQHIRSDGKRSSVSMAGATYYSPESFTKGLAAKNGSHYYDAVAAAGSNIKSVSDQDLLPGNPYLVIMLHSGNDAGANVDGSGTFEGFKHIRAMMGRFMILKNLMNVFIHIGSKFGGKEIYRDNFMKPVVIYRNLLKYLEISAFGMGLSNSPVTESVVGGGEVEGGSPTVELTFSQNEGSWSIKEQKDGFKFDTIAVARKLPYKEYLPEDWKPIDSSSMFVTVTESIGSMIGSALGLTSDEKPTIKIPLTPFSEDKVNAIGNIIDKAGITKFGSPPRADDALRIAKKVVKSYLPGGVKVKKQSLAGLRTQILNNDADGLRRNADVIANNVKSLISSGKADSGGILYLMMVQASEFEVPAASDLDIKIKDIEVGAMGGGESHKMRHRSGGSEFKGDSDVTYSHSPSTGEIHVRLGVAAKEFTDFVSSEIGPTVAARLSAMQKFGIYMRSVMPAFAGCECFQEADQYFVRIIKCLCAKVLTTVGMYDVLKRPYEPTNFNPVRMVLGAGRETPQIVDGAVELYFRLPLLAEFYRDLFSFNSGDSNRDGFIDYDSDKVKITMLPELEGMFSGIIKIIFRRNRTNKVGEFTDEELKDLIVEINKIYATMQPRHGDKTTLETVQEFVKEMNMRYGVIKKKDRDLYEEVMGEHYDYSEYQLGDERPINLAILPGEEDMEHEISVNPSLKYERGSAAETLKMKTSPFAIKYDAYKLFTEFRCMIDNYFMQAPHDPVADVDVGPDDAVKGIEELNGKLLETGSLTSSFRPMIQSTRTQVKLTQSPEEKFELVARMLRGSMTFESAESSKYLMFHETVVSGLDTLSAVFTVLRNFQKKIIALDYDGLMKMDGASAWRSALDVVRSVSAYYYSDPAYAPSPDDNMISERDVSAYYNFAGGRMATNPGPMFADFVEQMFAVGRDLGGLVDMKVVGSGVNVNFSNLIETIEKLFESVKYFIDLLRPYIKEETDPAKKGLMEKYIGKEETGSYYWLQEQLVEKLLKGRERAVSGSRPHEYVGLNQMQKKINSVFSVLQKSAALGSDLSSIVWWSAADVALVGAGAAHDMSAPINKLFLKSTGVAYEAVNGHSARFTGLYQTEDDKFNQLGSVVLSFNDLVAKYLHQFYDGSSEKIYKTAVEAFVNSFNQEIMNPSTAGNTLQDMTPVSDGWTVGGAALTTAASPVKGIKASEYPPQPVAKAGLFQPGGASPVGNQVLLESLAVVMKNIVSSRSVSNQSYIYMLDNIAEVSMFMKERYKMNMPLFKNMFAELLRKAEFIKELLEKHELPVDGVLDGTAVAMDAKRSRAFVARVLTSVVRGCSSMITCIDSVMREIADDPKYLETRAGFIAEYKGVYGKEPIAPISVLTLILGNQALYSTLPFSSQGSSQNKFKYGTRGVLGRIGTKVSIAQMPGFKKIVDTFNMTVNSRFAAEPGKMDSYIENLVKLLRFVNEVKFQKGVMSSKRTILSSLGFTKPINRRSNKTNAGMYVRNGNVTFSIAKGFDESINLVESGDQDGQISNICIHLAGASGKTENITIRNIIDLNIVPINVNAMMRDIPLVNMYNYEWTFNRMVIDLVFSLQDPGMASKMIQSLCVAVNEGVPPTKKYPIDRLRVPHQQSVKTGEISGVDTGYLITDEKSLFASMLINPYRKLWRGRNPGDIAQQHHQLLHNMMSGRSLTGLSRPKFLSDQLYNKALLRSVYGNNASVNTYPGTRPLNNLQENFIYPSFSGNAGHTVPAKLQNKDMRALYDIISQLRLDTVLCRDLMFITDSYRLLRLKLRKDFMYSKDVIVSSHGLIREDVTEFDLNLNK